MAELMNTGGRSSGRRRRKPPRIDMTAMVDVAFLLLTFFILTTTLQEQRAQNLTVPVQEGGDVQCSKVMTLYLGEDSQVHYFRGCDSEAVATVGSPEQARRAIREHLASIEDPIIAIKPLETSVFQDMVSIFDEMAITGAKKYALAPVTEDDKSFLALKGLK